MLGPSFEFRDFRDYINFEGVYKDIPRKQAMTAGFIELGKAAFNMLTYVIFMHKLSFVYCSDPEFGEKSAIYQVNFNKIKSVLLFQLRYVY